jgi:mono/diheme cytochrome c family protein
MKTLFAALLLSAIPTLALAQGGGDVAAGKKLWDGNELFCKNCHGRDGEGAFGPDLAGRGLSPAQFLKAVRKPWGVMPAFTEAQLSDAEAANLAAYFGTLQKVAEPGAWRVPVDASAPHGQQVYMSQGCAQCHGATFDMPRATFGGRAATYDDLRQLVYTHTDFMPKYEEQRPGQRLRMGNFNPLRIPESEIHAIYDWAHDDLGFRPQLSAQLTPSGGTTYALNVSNNGEAGKGLTAQGVVIDVLVPSGATVTGTTGAGYKGVHMDEKMKGNVAEWQVAKLAPKDAQAFTISLSQAPATPADLKGAIRWAKPAPKTGPNMDALNFTLRPAGGPGGGGGGGAPNRTAQ